METFVLENSQLKVSIKSQGAELTSIYDKRDKTEHLWQADPNVWGRHAPVLFPIVGQVQDGQYIAQGNSYELSQHGFARDFDYECISQSESHVSLGIASNEETLLKYPFRFELRISYVLEKSTVTTRYEVINSDDKKIYFSIGGHPGYSLPFVEGEKFEDYYLSFNKKESAQRLLLDGGLLSGKAVPFEFENGTDIGLNHGVFDDDAIIFENLESNKVAVKSRKSTKYVEFDFSGFPLLAFWTKPGGNAPYLCIEPWYGVADTRDSGLNYEDKKAIQSLELGETFVCAYDFSVVPN